MKEKLCTETKTAFASGCKHVYFRFKVAHF